MFLIFCFCGCIRRDEPEDQEEEEDEEDEEDQRNPTKSPDEASGSGSSKWFDAESKTRKAERNYQEQMRKLRADACKLTQEMQDTLSEFRSRPADAKEFCEEMSLVARRREWLVLVTNKDEEALASKIAEISEGKGADVASNADSRDASALARAGPCAGYEKLKTLSFLENMSSGFRECSTQDEVKKHFEETVPVKKLILVLMSSCKTAMSELTGARKKAVQAKERQREKEAKDAAEKQKAVAEGRELGSG